MTSGFSCRLTAAALLLSAGLTTASAQAADADGTWVVELTTTEGSCDKAYQWPFNVQSNMVGGEAGGVHTAGWIASTGLMSLTVTRGPDVFRLQGKRTGGAASGAWSSGSLYCGGRWKATKQKG
jgi:hypothetical protein